MKPIATRLPTVVSDRILDAIAAMGEMMIQMQIEFDSALDAERLAHALDLTLGAEPVLGCRYVSGLFRARWERCVPDERAALRVVASEEDFDTFKQEPIRSDRGPQLLGCLWQRRGGDRLLFKIGHCAADSGGLKQAVERVATIYRRLREDPLHVPTPNLHGSRSMWQVLRGVPVPSWPSIFCNFMREVRSNFSPLRTRALRLQGTPGEYVYVCRHLSRKQVAKALEFAHDHDAKINDIIVAAVFRSIAALSSPDPAAHYRLWTTVDFRRWYVPGGRAQGICNLSGFEFPNLGPDLGPDLGATLAKVVAYSKHRKTSWIGLSGVIGCLPALTLLPPRAMNSLCARLVKLGFDRENLPNGLTNLGPIDPEAVTFDTRPQHAFLLAPPMYPPGFGVGLSGYDGTLTLTTAVSPMAIGPVNCIFDRAEDELRTPSKRTA